MWEVIHIKAVHRIHHNQYELTIEQTSDYMYLIVMRRFVQGGADKILANFPSKRFAIQAAERFPEMYTIAQQEGYSLNGNEFVHPKGKRVPVSYAFDLDRSANNFHSLLSYSFF